MLIDLFVLFYTAWSVGFVQRVVYILFENDPTIGSNISKYFTE